MLTWSCRSVYVLVLLGLMCGLGARTTLPPSFAGDRVRSYFGVYTVLDDTADHCGCWSTAGPPTASSCSTPGLERTPTAYYGPTSGVGLVIAPGRGCSARTPRSASWASGRARWPATAQPGQTWQFFEIDPVVVRIARDSGQFHFLSDCAPDADYDRR